LKSFVTLVGNHNIFYLNERNGTNINNFVVFNFDYLPFNKKILVFEGNIIVAQLGEMICDPQ
jgi:hypothetical protein